MAQGIKVKPTIAELRLFDWSDIAAGVARDHLDLCNEALEAQETGEDVREGVQSPAAASYDGCSTCVVREVTLAAHPYLIADYLAAIGAVGPLPAAVQRAIIGATSIGQLGYRNAIMTITNQGPEEH